MTEAKEMRAIAAMKFENKFGHLLAPIREKIVDAANNHTYCIEYVFPSEIEQSMRISIFHHLKTNLGYDVAIIHDYSSDAPWKTINIQF